MCNVSVCLSEKLKCRPKHVEAPQNLMCSFGPFSVLVVYITNYRKFIGIFPSNIACYERVMKP